MALLTMEQQTQHISLDKYKRVKKDSNIFIELNTVNVEPFTKVKEHF